MTRNYQNITADNALKELTFSNDAVLALDAQKAREIRKRIAFIEKAMLAEMGDERIFNTIWSIPGFGILSSTYISCMIDDITRFEGRSFVALFGLTPALDESADKPKHCSISRRGDPDLRRLICQATFVHIFNTERS